MLTVQLHCLEFRPDSNVTNVKCKAWRLPNAAFSLSLRSITFIIQPFSIEGYEPGVSLTIWFPQTDSGSLRRPLFVPLLPADLMSNVLPRGPHVCGVSGLVNRRTCGGHGFGQRSPRRRSLCVFGPAEPTVWVPNHRHAPRGGRNEQSRGRQLDRDDGEVATEDGGAGRGVRPYCCCS